MVKILFYEDQYYLFSNFSAHAVSYKGKLYPTAEHAYQAAKFDVPEIIELIRTAKSPMEAKNLANGVFKEKKNKNWNKIKVDIMYEIVKEKVIQHDEVKRILLETGDKEIVENSPDDYFWGGGKDGSGENHLGKILMRIREELT